MIINNPLINNKIYVIDLLFILCVFPVCFLFVLSYPSLSVS